MNRLTMRQKKILKHMMINEKQLYKIDELAILFGCSEKTMRTDMKQIIEFSRQIDGLEIYSKRGSGIIINVNEQGENDLIEKLERTNYSEEREMLALNISTLLLKQPIYYSLKDLSTAFYSNVNEIKAAIDIIKNWLEKFDIVLVIKKGQGVTLIGDELSYRNAIKFITSLKLNQLSNQEMTKKFFGDHVYKLVSDCVHQVYGEQLLNDQLERLSLHILIMIHRIQHKNTIQIDEIHQFDIHEKLYDLIDLLEQKLAIHIPKSEMNYITLHLPSALYHQKNIDESGVTRFINHLIKEMQQEAMIDFSKDKVLIDGLKTHISTSLFNIKHAITINNPLQFEIKTQYPFIFSSVVNALQNLKGNFKYEIPESEMAYLTLHFQASFERMKQSEIKKVLIVCHLGIGISQMLKVKIERKFTAFEIVAVAGLDDYPSIIQNQKIDLIITTVNLSNHEIETIKVSPLLTENDEHSLNRYFEKSIGESTVDIETSKILQFITPFTIFKNSDIKERYKLIEMLGRKLIENQYVSPEYIKSVANREYLSATCIGNGIAIPHGDTQLVYTSSISIVSLEQPIIWGEEYVDLVFLIALTDKDKKYYHDIYRELHYLIEEKHTLNQIRTQNNILEILKSINEKKLPE